VSVVTGGTNGACKPSRPKDKPCEPSVGITLCFRLCFNQGPGITAWNLPVYTLSPEGLGFALTRLGVGRPTPTYSLAKSSEQSMSVFGSIVNLRVNCRYIFAGIYTYFYRGNRLCVCPPSALPCGRAGQRLHQNC
jgi:hypothetical protein